MICYRVHLESSRILNASNGKKLGRNGYGLGLVKQRRGNLATLSVTTRGMTGSYENDTEHV